MKSALYGKRCTPLPPDTEQQGLGEGTWAQAPGTGCCSAGDGGLLLGFSPRWEAHWQLHQWDPGAGLITITYLLFLEE